MLRATQGLDGPFDERLKMTDTTQDLSQEQDQQQDQLEEVKNPAAVLKKNKELLSRNAAQSTQITEQATRITELEAQIQRLTEDNERLSKDFSEFHIRRPLARLAEEVSDLPDVWMAEFTKHYDLRPVEGDDLGIFDKEGNRCVWPKGHTDAGQPVQFTARDIWWMLCSDNLGGGKGSPESKRWWAMTRYLGPQGTGAPGSTGWRASPSPATESKKEAEAPKPAYGIR